MFTFHLHHPNAGMAQRVSSSHPKSNSKVVAKVGLESSACFKSMADGSDVTGESLHFSHSQSQKETTTTWNFHSSSSVETGHRPQGETLASASSLGLDTRAGGCPWTRLRHFLEKQEQDGGHRLTPVQEKAVMCSGPSTIRGEQTSFLCSSWDVK